MTLCTEKHRYQTRDQAEDSAALLNASAREVKIPGSIRTRNRRKHRAMTLRVYQCRYCGGFHLTSSRPTRRAA